MVTEVEGVSIGHWTDPVGRTGCTVVVFPPGTVASGEIRGGAPASREFALLDPIRTIQHVDAVVLSGGSAFGLAAADGVMAGLEVAGRGFETDYGPVPIVVGLSLFDLGEGDPNARPGPDQGRLALDRALGLAPLDSAESGAAGSVFAIGAGTGATVGKWQGRRDPGGLVSASLRHGEVVVAAVVAVNAFGAVDDGTPLADPEPPVRPTNDRPDGDGPGNTTIGVVVTNAVADKIGCLRLAQGAHGGLARALRPAHTAADGDGFVVGATGEVEADPHHLRAMVETVVVRAVARLRSNG